MSQITFTLDVTAENLPKIMQIIQTVSGVLTISESETELTNTDAENKTSAKKSASAKSTGRKTTAKKDNGKTTYTLTNVKAIVRKAKGEHGEDFITDSLDELGVDDKPTLAKRLSAVSTDDYPEFVKILEAGPVESDDDLGDLDDDDGLGDEVTADAVKEAIRAYVKDVGRVEAKEVMTKHNIANIGAIDKASPETLANMMADLT